MVTLKPYLCLPRPSAIVPISNALEFDGRSGDHHSRESEPDVRDQAAVA
jgi:hypothetical protein